MRVCTLASGSSGNSLLIETGSTKILVDAGINLKQTSARLKTLGVQISDIDAVIVTHEHTDHTSGLPYLNQPVYIASATLDLWKDKVPNVKEFDTGSPFCINDLLISPFPIPHDALDPVGFTIQTDGRKIGVVTDIGSVTALVKERLKGANVLIMEFNHDDRMLMYSSYPWVLKQRIKSRLGHLSNEEAGGLLGSLIHNGLRHVVLAHLSETNNRPVLALDAAVRALTKNGAQKDIKVSVAPRRTIGEVIII